MQHTRDLLTKLRADYPDISFAKGDDYFWSSVRKTITYVAEDDNELFVLHELAHALLGHRDFSLDIELVSQERAAWDLVRSELASHYDAVYDDAIIENALETYREWLHARSQCPHCGQTGLQTKTSTYVCINCRCSWRPNDARRCALRRYVIA